MNKRQRDAWNPRVLEGSWFCLGEAGGRGALPLWVYRQLAHLRLAESHPSACPASSLKKMTVGMFLASMAFVAAAIVQVEIEVSCFLILQWPFLVGLVERPSPGLRG